MRPKLLIGLGIAAMLLLIRNIYVIFNVLPDEAMQGAIYRILFFHVPAAWIGLFAGFAAMVASLIYLVRRDLRYDALALSITEVGLAFGMLNIFTGMLWARVIWGVWWAWDARLTSALVLMLIYIGYIMIRPAFEDPTARARAAAVMSLFAFADTPIVIFSIVWWRTQHPQPVVTGNRMDPAMREVLWLNLLALLLVAIVLVVVRMRQEETQREVDALRRVAHAY